MSSATASRNGTPVIDVDRHVQETWNIFQKYAEPQFRDHMYRKVSLPDGSEHIAIGERVLPFSVGLWDDPYSNELYEDGRFSPNDDDVKALDPEGYLRAMDEEGIDAAYITPTLAMGNCSIPNGIVGSAASRAYGRWAQEFTSIAPDRLLAFYPLNLYDVEQAMRDVRWAAEELEVRGFQLISLPVGPRNLHHEDFDPVWSLIQDLDRPIQMHSLSSLPDEEGRGPLVELAAGVNQFGGNLFMHHLVSHRIEQHLAMASLICCGVLQRFPRLRFVFVEAGAGWIPSWLEEMDNHFHQATMRRWVPWLEHPPSEYFQRQCLAAYTADEATVSATAPLLGAGCVAWSSDYPHHDGVYPGAVEAMSRQLGGFSEADRNRILGGNAARFCNLA